MDFKFWSEQIILVHGKVLIFPTEAQISEWLLAVGLAGDKPHLSGWRSGCSCAKAPCRLRRAIVGVFMPLWEGNGRQRGWGGVWELLPLPGYSLGKWMVAGCSFPNTWDYRGGSIRWGPSDLFFLGSLAVLKSLLLVLCLADPSLCWVSVCVEAVMSLIYHSHLPLETAERLD